MENFYDYSVRFAQHDLFVAKMLNNESLPSRSVDELTTFYILRWVNNVFHILLKILHIIVWFGPNCSGKSTPSFRIYDMIKKYAEMSFSPCVYNRKNVHYVANGII